LKLQSVKIGVNESIDGSLASPPKGVAVPITRLISAFTQTILLTDVPFTTTLFAATDALLPPVQQVVAIAD